MTDAYKNLIEAARLLLASPVTDGNARALLAKALENAEKELEPCQP